MRAVDTAVDTNVLVRLIARDDLRQTASAEAFVSQGAWVSTLALAETMWVLTAVYKRVSKELSAALEMLLNHRSLTIQDADLVAGAIDLFRNKPRLEFSDCRMLQIARRAGHLPIGTFDRTLAMVEGTQKL